MSGPSDPADRPDLPTDQTLPTYKTHDLQDSRLLPDQSEVQEIAKRPLFVLLAISCIGITVPTAQMRVTPVDDARTRRSWSRAPSSWQRRHLS